MPETVVGNVLLLANIESKSYLYQNKTNWKILSDISFIFTKNAKLKYPEICTQNWHVIVNCTIF